MKKILIGCALFLSACSMDNLNVTNPFATTTEVTSVYTSQFPDVPIPVDMKSKADETLTTISSSGEKVGRETFGGRVEHNSLGAAMAHNLKNQGWMMLGIVQGERTMQLYQKGGRYLIVTIEDGTIEAKLEVWMISQVGGGFGQNVQSIMNPTDSTTEQNFDSFGSESLFK